MKNQKKKQMIRRIIVIAIAVCVVLALVLPLFVKADVAIGGDVNYREADYYVTAEGPNGKIEMYYGPGLEYGIDYYVDNGEELHIIETAENIYDQLQWGCAETEAYNRWVRLDHTRTDEQPATVESTLQMIFKKIIQLITDWIRDILEYFQ